MSLQKRLRRLRSGSGSRHATGLDPTALASYGKLRELMSRYQVKDLVGVEPQAFKARLDSFQALTDHTMEGFASPEGQRDLTIRFHWGHDHDFGDFALQGRMGTRHLLLLAIFMDEFAALPQSLDGCRVLDIGCWTGGTSLLLHALGAEVHAIEEVQKYVDSLSYLRDAFGLERLTVERRSLYECTVPQLQDGFDYVLFAGVLYHVTDPVLALRIVFNCLTDGGTALVETAAFDSDRPVLAYEGPKVVKGGTKEELSRGGWNWFLPSPSTLEHMMYDVGFDAVSVSDVMLQARVYAVGRRTTHRPMLRSGLSAPHVR